MKAAGFSFSKGELRYTLIEGSKKAPVLRDRKRLTVAKDIKPEEISNWYYANFLNLLSTPPDIVAYRFFYSQAKETTRWAVYPCAILGLYCYQNGLPVEEWVTQNFTAKMFGQPTGSNWKTTCDNLLGQHPPHWDDKQRNSALAAMASLP